MIYSALTKLSRLSGHDNSPQCYYASLFLLHQENRPRDVRKHEFKVGSSQPSLVLEKGFTDIGQYVLLNGSKISSFKLAFGGEEELTATIEILGAKETVSATPYMTEPTEVELFRFTNMQATVEEGGASIGIITKGEFTINAGLDGNQYTVGGDGIRKDIHVGTYKISGSITALFDGASLMAKAMDSTKSSLKVKFNSGAHSLDFLFPEIKYERSTPGITGPAGVLITLPFYAFYDTDAEGTAVKATLINDVSTYA